MSSTLTDEYTNNTGRHRIGDLVIKESYNFLHKNKPVFGIVVLKQYDKRWHEWYYGIDWHDDSDKDLDNEVLLKYRDADISEFKYNIRDWLDIA